MLNITGILCVSFITARETGFVVCLLVRYSERFCYEGQHSEPPYQQSGVQISFPNMNT